MNGAAILIYVDGECRPLDDRREIRRRDLEMLFRSLVHFQEQRAKVLHDTGHHVPGFRRDHDLATGRHGHPFRPAGQDNPRICRRRDLAADTDPVAARQRRFRAADRVPGITADVLYGPGQAVLRQHRTGKEADHRYKEEEEGAAIKAFH